MEVGASKNPLSIADLTRRRTAGRICKPYCLTMRDACAHAGVSRTRLEQALREGSIVARRAGRRTLVITDSLEAWIDALPLAQS